MESSNENINENEEEFLKNLNKEQKEAVKYTKGPQIISAGAGTGKTTVLTYKIGYLIYFKKISPYKILALTFTKKAADEMKERIKLLIGEMNTKGLVIGTFHSIFLRILRENIHLIGTNYNKYFTIRDKKYMKNEIKRILNEYYDIPERKKEKIGKNSLDLKEEEENYKIILKYIIKKISLLQNKGISYEDYEKYDNLIKEDEKEGRSYFKKVYKEYCQNCEKENIMDFDGILINTYILFKKNKDLLYKYQNMFDYILIDEYQDTNNVQFEIIKAIAFKSQKIFVIGDENQCIYQFRGSRIENINDFKLYFNNVEISKLVINYRSTDNIVKCANSLIRHNSNVINLDLYSLIKSNEKVKIIRNADDDEEVNKIASIIKEKVEENGCKYKDFCILYRANIQSFLFKKNFLNRNIPYITYKKIGIFDSVIKKTIINYLELIVNKNNNTAFKYIINKPKRGIGEQTQKKIYEYSKRNNINYFDIIQDILTEKKLNLDFNLTESSIKQLESFYNLINKYKEQSNVISASQLVSSLITDLNFKDLKESDKSKIDILLEKIKEMEKEYKSLTERTYYLRDYLQEIMVNIDNEEVEELNGKNYQEKFLEKNKVKLMTIHSSKGLEFDYIFIVGFENGSYPSRKNNDIEEERRVLYVGITRSKKNCYISYADKRNFKGEMIKRHISMFYYDIDKNLMEEYSTNNNYVYVPFKNEINDNIEKFNNVNVIFKEKKVEKNNNFENQNIKRKKIDLNLKESISKNEYEIIENNNNINLEENMDKKENNNTIKKKDIKKKKIKEKEEEKKEDDLKLEDTNSESSTKNIGKKRILKGQTFLDCFLRTSNK